MKTRHWLAPALVALAATACKDGTTAPVPTTTGATVSLLQASSPVPAMAIADSGIGAPTGLVTRAMVDSLMVNVRAVAIRPRLERFDSLFPDSLPDGDTCRAFGAGGPFDPDGWWARRGFGPPPPPPESLRIDDWLILEVVSGGRLDLLRLPTEADNGLVVASGAVPAGEYHGVALLIDSGTIWLNTPVVSPRGDTLAAGVGIPVAFPAMGVYVPTDVTVPVGGGDFAIVFDVSETLRTAIITPARKVVVAPVLRHRLRSPF